MSAQYITKAGDTFDSIAWAYYGATDNQITEQLITANPGLSDAPELAAGITINLPVITTPVTQQGVRLWD
jgi:phage tail protein X